MLESRPRAPAPLLDSANALAELGELALSPTVEGAVDAIRELLGMEVAYASEINEREQVLHAVRGDGGSFGIGEGTAIPLEETYCHRVLAGRLPNLIPDVRAEERVASLPVTEAADIGAFASVPLVFSDGRTHGTLCALSHRPKASLGYRELRFMQVFARMIADQLERETLARKTQSLEDTAHQLECEAAAATALVAAVEARDAYTGDHSKAVVASAVAVGRDLGLSESAIRDLKHLALLHDIGKIAVPDAILGKRGKLSAEEWEVMRQHPLSSEKMIKDIPSLKHLAPMIRAEHERWDGGGYPDGLRGEQIPQESRIVFVCDAFHAMTSDRPYRKALPIAEARKELAANAGTQFCPRTAAAALATIAK